MLIFSANLFNNRPLQIIQTKKDAKRVANIMRSSEVGDFYSTLSGIRVNLRNSYIFFQNDIICLFACRSNNSKPLEEELLGYLSLTGVVNGCSYNLQIAAD